MRSNTTQSGAPDLKARRGFLRKMTALLLGCGAALVPVAAGLVAGMNPLRRRVGSAEAIRVTSLDALPDDGVPRRFPVVSTRQDGWTRTPETPVGAVYLRRTGPATVEALNVICPHAGCVVRYAPAVDGFECPCHKSSFDLTGRILGRGSPSPRDLDTLEVEVRDENEVWVRFQNFRTGRTEKVPVA